MIKHLALIMDGNRRWAIKRGLKTMQGHKEGVKVVKTATQFCLDNSIPFLSLYAFSIENFKRSSLEKRFLFNILNNEVNNGIKEFNDNGIRIRFIGDRDLFPKSVIKSCNKAEESTKNNKKLTLNFLFCYGGRQEIIAGIKKLLAFSKNNEVKLTEDLFKSFLWSGSIPDPEIIVRTGERNRLSNFFLFQSAYSEIRFLDKLWPDLRKEDFEEILYKFKGTVRNFGK